jgi:hypothetical protein
MTYLVNNPHIVPLVVVGFDSQCHEIGFMEENVEWYLLDLNDMLELELGWRVESFSSERFHQPYECNLSHVRLSLVTSELDPRLEVVQEREKTVLGTRSYRTDHHKQQHVLQLHLLIRAVGHLFDGHQVRLVSYLHELR